MADPEEQLNDIRRDLFRQIRIICDPLYKFNGPVTRDFHRTAGSCMSDLLQLLTSVQDPEASLDMVLIDAVLYPLLRIFKQSAQSTSRSDTIVQGVLENLLFLLNETLWPCTFTPMLMKQYLILFVNCLNQTRQVSNFGNIDGDNGNNNNNSNTQMIPPVTSGATEIIKILAIRCMSATLPIPPSRITRTTSPHSNKYQPNKYRHNMDLLPALLSNQFIYVISQCITELLDTIEHDHDLALRLTALDTLHQLLFDNIQESDYLINFMPGVVSKLCKVIWQKQEKENNQVITYALDLVGDMIQTVMNYGANKNFVSNVDSLDDLKHIWLTISAQGTPLDSTIGKTVSCDNSKKNNNSDVDDDHSTTANAQRNSIKIERTLDWYSKSKSTLHTFCKDILKICHHPNWNVRLAFVNFSYKLLAHCWATLDNCIPLFIDIMVQLVDDEYPQVSITCKECISQLKSTRLFETTLIPELKDGLHAAILGLPQQLISGDEQSKLYAMRRITGYTYFLQHHAGTVFDASLNRMSDGWMAALEIDKHSLNVLEEKQSARYIGFEDDGIGAVGEEDDSRLPRTVTFPKLRFKHLVTTATADQAAHMLNVIGRYAPVQQWLIHFMAYIQVDTYSSDSTLSSLDHLLPQAAFIVHSLLAGATTADVGGGEQDGFVMNSMVAYDDGGDGGDERLDKVTLQKLTRLILTDMTETLTAATTTTLGSKNKMATSVMVDNAIMVDLEGNRVVTICLGLQIISLAVGILGKEDTIEHLITLLYPILAHLGSTNAAVHLYARISLDNIALVCGERNGRLLAMNNMDYIINAVSQRISMLYDHPQAPLVLKALVHICGATSIDYLQDSVEEIFDALDRYYLHGGLCRQLCGVLVEIVQTTANSISTTTAAKATTLDSDSNRSSGDDKNENVTECASSPIKEFIKQHREAKEDASTVFDTPNTIDDIGKYFMEQRRDGKEDKDILELMAQTENAGKENNDTQTTNDSTDDHRTTESAVTLTNAQDLTLKIMLKSTHFLTSPSAQLRSQMLQLFADGVRILAAHPNKLDPVIHQVWPLIMNRLDDKVHYVAFYAAQVVQVLAEIRGEFISWRFMENVWPRYERLLHQGEINMTSASMVYSTYSYPHRLLRCLLETLLLAVNHIPLNQPTALAIVESTTWLLSQTRVHAELQTLTIRLYLALFRHHPDTVWLHVFSLLETPVLQPPLLSDNLDTIKLATLVVPNWMAKHNKEYYNNAGKIMSSMERGNCI